VFKDFIKLIRVKQWTKNVFVLAAFVFTKGWKDWSNIQETLLAVLGMCLISSATYVVNDIFDVEKDRRHPKKKNRPIASGRMPIPLAATTAIGLLAFGMLLGWLANPPVLYVFAAYLLIQVAYNLGLRNQAVIDVGCIAAGFVVRVVLGAVAISSQVSGWILLCTATVALMIGFGKRRHEFMLKAQLGGETRKSLADYSQQSLDVLVALSATCAAMSYSVYSIESQTAHLYPALILTTPWVLYGICRYVIIVFGTGETGEPESLVFGDKQLIIVFVGYLVSAVLALKRLPLPFLIQ
jgi:4-hydroxybenzoate polyprenyltransferase